MAHAMTRDEWHAFVLEGTRTAKIGVTRLDGAPHVAPIWVLLDGDDVMFTTGAETIKGKCLRRDGRVVLAFDDDQPPFAFVLIEGTAEISEDLNEMLAWATRLGARYMGEERAEEFGRRNAVKGELLVRVHPTKVIAQTGISD
jgi:PPOX class probable F420-dependent enzyme